MNIKENVLNLQSHRAYKANIISTIVDRISIVGIGLVAYKANIIFTIVDQCYGAVAYVAYKANINSTIVDRTKTNYGWSKPIKQI